MTTADQVLAVARKELGYKESGGNNNKYGTAFKANRQAWCAWYVTWCFNRAPSGGKLILVTGSTVNMANWFKARNQYGLRPRVGAVVFYQFPSSDKTIASRINHCGIVEAVHADGTITVIEGNTSGLNSRDGDGVYRKRRSATNMIRGYGYPLYAKSKIQVKKTVPVSSKLVVDGVFGPITAKALQRRLGVKEDGVFKAVSIKALQKILGRQQTGVMSKTDIEALQRKVKVAVDGSWGPETTRGIQRAVNEGQL